jgi:hypothetical protein
MYNNALIGFAGLIIGIFLNEYFRRRSRIEIITKEIFVKRLNVFEELYRIILDAENTFYTLERENDQTTNKQLWEEKVIKVANYLDEHFLYIDENISVQCMLTLIGAEELLIENNNDDLEKVSKDFKETKKLIKSVAGVSATEKSLSKIGLTP